MDNLVRREIIETAKTLVIKIGTNVLSRPMTPSTSTASR
jgi:hypothetical protein